MITHASESKQKSLNNLQSNADLYEEVRSINNAINLAAKKGEFECEVDIEDRVLEQVFYLYDVNGYEVSIISDSKIKFAWYKTR